MKVFDFNLSASKNGGNITAFNYSHGLNDLVGSWSASVAGGSFLAGEAISFSNVLTDGVISNAFKDSSGLWHLEGKDAGVKLMRSTPDIADLPTGHAKDVLSTLADFCDIDLVMNFNGLSGFNVRSIISGSTCAEAVLELAMFSGCIAFIDNLGRLNVSTPASIPPTFSDVIDDSGSDIDLDGYATHVLVSITRNNTHDDNPNDDDDDPVEYYSGTTPSTSTETVEYSGSLPNGSYSYSILQPFGVTSHVSCSVSQNGVTVTTTEEHDYEYKHKTIWRDNTEYVLFAFCERSYSLTRITQGSYTTSTGKEATFKETTTENMNRTFSIFEAVGVPDDWVGDIDMVSSETITRSTVREGPVAPDDNMPPYAPPFDSMITRSFSLLDFGKALFCNEIEQTYEARQVGSIAPVKKDNVLLPLFMRDSYLAIQTHSSPQWVLVNKYSDYYEQFNDDGDCIISTKSEYSDDGAKWLSEHALSSTGDEHLDELQEAYARFSQQSNGLQINVGQSNFSANQWHFLELQGRTKSTTQKSDVLSNSSEWYDNGQYLYSKVCPHYNNSVCTVFSLDGSYASSRCNRIKGTRFWQSCPRAIVALELARQNDSALLDSVIFGSASSKAKKFVGYQRDIYIDELITDDYAQTIADTIAQNILSIKGRKGIRKTVTVPYDPSFMPDGYILEVSHDWDSLQTSVTYLLDTNNIPDFMISDSVASIAAFVAARENSRLLVMARLLLLRVKLTPSILLAASLNAALNLRMFALMM